MGRKKKTKKAAAKRAGREKPLKDLMDSVHPENMGTFSSLYLDPIEGGFKITIWSGKEGLIEGFVSGKDMPIFVRKVLVNRTESLAPGESIELIGKREEDIALIAEEPIQHPEVRGVLTADLSMKETGEVHLKITLQRERAKAGEPEANIDHLTELFNQDIKKNMGIPEYEAKATGLVGELRKAQKLTKNHKDRKTMESICKASKALGSLSKKYGFVKISQLSDSMAVLFDAYLEKGGADPASLPIVLQTVEMLERMVAELSHGPDVDYLVSRISRKDSAS